MENSDNNANTYGDEVEMMATLKELQDKTKRLMDELHTRYEKKDRAAAARLCDEIRVGLRLIKECEADILRRPDR